MRTSCVWRRERGSRCGKESTDRSRSEKGKSEAVRKHAPPRPGMLHLLLKNLIILITVPLWEIHQLSWFGRGQRLKKRGGLGTPPNKRKESLIAITRQSLELSNRRHKQAIKHASAVNLMKGCESII